MARGLRAERSTARGGVGQEGRGDQCSAEEGEEDVSERRKTKGEVAYQPERTPQDDTESSNPPNHPPEPTETFQKRPPQTRPGLPVASHTAAGPTRRPGLQAKRAPVCQQQEVMGPATRWVEAAPQPPPTRRMTTQPGPSTSDDSIRPPARGERRPSTGTLSARKFHEGRGRGTLGYIWARCGCTMFAPACLFVERPGACAGPNGSKRCSRHSIAFTVARGFWARAEPHNGGACLNG